MMEQRQTHSAETGPGLMAGLAGLAKNGFALLVSRIELASLELGEVRNNIARLLLVGALGIVALWFALGCWTALIIVLAWETMGWKILLIVAAAYSLLALGILLYARSMLDGDQLSMPATLNELRNDRDALL
ncbi:phage holin family protein [Herbaspirillum sp. ST 5-3]|uniref:phage holin family protein n=1 Tax=Oxalobacteraceae TaxID=75682 RepID=UPI0032B722C9